MIVRPDPFPLRWLVGVELARHRNAAGMSMTEVSAALGMSKAKIGHLETGRQLQTSEDIRALLTTYGIARQDIERLCGVAGRVDHATWWTPWAPVLPDWLRTFAGLEGLAESEFAFEPMIIPAVLQTEEYARAVVANSPSVRRDQSERVVGFHMARTRRLLDANRPLRLHAVVAEAALRLRVGPPELHRDQLRHLIKMAAEPNVALQVVRPEDGLHTAVTGQFVVFGFADLRSIGFAELHDGGVYIHDPAQVHSCTLAAEDVRRVALGPEQSLEHLEGMLQA